VLELAMPSAIWPVTKAPIYMYSH